MTMETLTSVLFESHLRLFAAFKIVSQSIAQLGQEASLEDKLKIFEDAMRSEEEINIPREDLQHAVQALVVKVFKDESRESRLLKLLLTPERPQRWARKS